MIQSAASPMRAAPMKRTMGSDRTALSFRFFGPLRRFDHHRGTGPERDPADDPERGISYAGGSHETDDGLRSDRPLVPLLRAVEALRPPSWYRAGARSRR